MKKRTLSKRISGIRILFSLSLFLLLFQNISSADSNVLSWDSLGSIKVGMTNKEVEKILNKKLIADTSGRANEQCYIAYPPSGPKGLSFLLTHWKVARIYINDMADQTFSTAAGVKIGTSDPEVKKIYPQAKIAAQPYYEGGHIYEIPSADSKKAIIVETDGKKVISMRAGQYPEVSFEEGCN